MPLSIVLLVALALAFDFINGFHDSANSIATVVSTRVLSPRTAVIWAAFFNFIAFLIFPLHIANTVGQGIIDPAIVDARVIAATLIGASAWEILLAIVAFEVAFGAVGVVLAPIVYAWVKRELAERVAQVEALIGRPGLKER